MRKNPTSHTPYMWALSNGSYFNNKKGKLALEFRENKHKKS